MDHTRLRSLLAIAEHGGFGRAAAALGLAQPSLSRQIALLEQEVGRPLLYRHGRGARLTEDGQRLADAARPLLTGLANLASVLEDPVPRGEVVLGVPTFMSVHIAESIFGEFRQRHPQLHIRLVDGFSGFIMAWAASRSAGEGLKRTVAPAFTATFSPVRGFIAMRLGVSRTEKAPNSGMVKRPVCTISALMASMMAPARNFFDMISPFGVGMGAKAQPVTAAKFILKEPQGPAQGT
ncbi:LysR family transcriptional regulator [Pseudoroseomonas oryzae]|uniref:LysR family transcriptional regulator n=1 Tax=Teichococcus oryzae TaxID=1608942 RepID=A0A5B2TCM8_9PROT|nr:LysR family transcriptional regulator [Pseudoroseomonas oryzae]